MIPVAIITLSDAGFCGEREDKSGPLIKELVERAGFAVSQEILLPDDYEQLKTTLIQIADNNVASLILTTGGTGFSKRDCTPEATAAVIERAVPGIPEAIRAYSMQITKRAMLSRGTAGIRKNSLIINLPGSPKAVKECLEYILPELTHGLEILIGSATNCARE